MTADIINLAERKRKKEVESSLARGRVPLTSTHLVPPPPSADGDSFADRIVRIKASLEKINILMADLKKNIGEGKK